MFQHLLLFKLSGIQKFDQELSGLFNLINKSDISLDNKVVKYLESIIEYAKTYHDHSMLKNSQSWMSTIQMSQNNINPYTLEEVKVYKSKMRSVVYYKILNDIAEYFSQREKEIEFVLEKTRELTSQMILAGFQLNVLKAPDILVSYTKDEIMTIWRKLATIEQTKIFQYNILLLSGAYDAYLILEEGMKMLVEV